MRKALPAQTRAQIDYFKKMGAIVYNDRPGGWVIVEITHERTVSRCLTEDDIGEHFESVRREM